MLALSRTLCAGSADATAFAVASLTAAARDALPGGRSGRRDWSFSIEQGDGTRMLTRRQRPQPGSRVKQSLLFEHSAGHRQQAVGDGAQSAAVAVAAPFVRPAGRMIKRVAVAYEAGRDGFWLARCLRAHAAPSKPNA